MYALQLTAIRVVFFLIRCLPVRACGALGAGLGRVFYRIDKKHQKTSLDNLTLIYPEKEANWHAHIARESFAELGRTLFELPHVFLRSRSFLLSRVTIKGEAAFREAMAQQKGVFLMASHHSNWELGGLMISLLNYDSSIIHSPLRQPALEAFLSACRCRFGAQLHARKEGLRWMPKALRQGRCAAIMIDQHQVNGMSVPFLGQDAMTTTLPAAFVYKYGTPIYSVILHRHAHEFRFCLEFKEIDAPPEGDDKALSAHALMSNVNAYFSKEIYARPELWLWSHRRWRDV
ncbi:MAG: lauroyl acyltransferase [Mariprofundaceae bacterium]|nr:lauroyl acyltransferase [Mariprofundaceae bacterium]